MKAKKVLAMLMASAMIMGTSVTAFAADAGISITDADDNLLTIFDADDAPDGVQLSYVKVIKADPTKRTGWDFVDDDTIWNCYANAFSEDDGIVDVEEAQQVVIEALIEEAEDAGTGVVNTSAIAKALSNVAGVASYTTATDNPIQVNEPGVYAIKAIQKGYTYNNMAAYVGFGDLDGEGVYPTLEDTELTAKRTPTDVDKETTDDDKLTAVDSIVTYNITTTVPFINPNDTNKTFEIVDTIYGANYYLTGKNSTATVTMDGTPVADVDDFEVVDNSFSIDLSHLIDGTNSNAGKTITVTYTAKVTGEYVENIAGTHVGDDNFSSDPVKVYTGKITLTKTDKNSGEKLAGAGFEVRKDDVNGDKLTFSKNEDGDYTYDEDGTVTEVFTGESGTVTIHGLDEGMYYFKETTAPTGYHIANSPQGYDASAEIKAPNGEATSVVAKDTNLTNTKLSSLPSTGGIGTTIFTIGGCAIMVTAAGLYFATRKKTEK